MLRAFSSYSPSWKKRVTTSWMVAPIENQSGIGTAIRITGESRELVDHGGQKFAFDGTPTDAFKVAINVVMPEKPDLVISGVNDGPNFGEAHTNSGTVGGAARAVRHGYPAIASSLNHLGPPPEGETPETIIVPAVDFTVRLVNILNDEWKAGRMLMPLGTGLSLNYPFETPPGWPSWRTKSRSIPTSRISRSATKMDSSTRPSVLIES